MSQHAAIAVLDDRAVLSVKGEDARHFLHNVVTADVESLGEGEARYGALLTPQGKILFDFFIVATQEGFLVDGAAAADGLLQRLMLYKLRAKVELAREPDLAVAAAWGEEPPAQGIFCYPDPRLEGFGWRLIGPPEALAAIANASLEDYHRRRLVHGLADSTDIGSAEVFPHEANLDQLGGISFSKGCYVGQEVVSRMQHRGTARSRMVPLDVSGPAETGSDITAGERPVGRLLSVAGEHGLGLVRLDRVETARQSGVALKTGASEVTIRQPHWARWTIGPGTAGSGEDD